MEKNELVMTVKEVAQYLKVHTSTVYRLVQSGELPGFKIGGDWRFNKESIDRWRIEQEQEHVSKSLSRKTRRSVENAGDNFMTRKEGQWLIDLHGNRKLFIDVPSGEQKILWEEVS